jgi:hypothetical protein
MNLKIETKRIKKLNEQAVQSLSEHYVKLGENSKVKESFLALRENRELTTKIAKILSEGFKHVPQEQKKDVSEFILQFSKALVLEEACLEHISEDFKDSKSLKIISESIKNTKKTQQELFGTLEETKFFSGILNTLRDMMGSISARGYKEKEKDQEEVDYDDEVPFGSNRPRVKRDETEGGTEAESGSKSPPPTSTGEEPKAGEKPEAGEKPKAGEEPKAGEGSKREATELEKDVIEALKRFQTALEKNDFKERAIKLTLEENSEGVYREFNESLADVLRLSGELFAEKRYDNKSFDNEYIPQNLSDKEGSDPYERLSKLVQEVIEKGLGTDDQVRKFHAITLIGTQFRNAITRVASEEELRARSDDEAAAPQGGLEGTPEETPLSKLKAFIDKVEEKRPEYNLLVRVLTELRQKSLFSTMKRSLNKVISLLNRFLKGTAKKQLSLVLNEQKDDALSNYSLKRLLETLIEIQDLMGSLKKLDASTKRRLNLPVLFGDASEDDLQELLESIVQILTQESERLKKSVDDVLIGDLQRKEGEGDKQRTERFMSQRFGLDLNVPVQKQYEKFLEYLRKAQLGTDLKNKLGLTEKKLQDLLKRTQLLQIFVELSEKAKALPEEEKRKLRGNPDQIKKRLAIVSVIHHAKSNKIAGLSMDSIPTGALSRSTPYEAIQLLKNNPEKHFPIIRYLLIKNLYVDFLVSKGFSPKTASLRVENISQALNNKGFKDNSLEDLQGVDRNLTAPITTGRALGFHLEEDEGQEELREYKEFLKKSKLL